MADERNYDASHKHIWCQHSHDLEAVQGEYRNTDPFAGIC